MLNEFVEVMIAFYESYLDMDTEVLPGQMIKHKIYKPHTKFREYLEIYIYVSNQTKGFYIDSNIKGTITNLNVYEVPELIREWDKLSE